MDLQPGKQIVSVATRGSRRLLLAGAASALTASAGGLLVPGLRQEAAAGLKGIRVTFNPNGTGPFQIEGWAQHDKQNCHGSNCRSRWEWDQDWTQRQVGYDQEETFDTGTQDLVLVVNVGGGEPLFLAFSNPTFGRPDVTVGAGSISHPHGPKYIAHYLKDKGLSEGESVTVLNNLYRIERRNDDDRKDRKVFVITFGV